MKNNNNMQSTQSVPTAHDLLKDLFYLATPTLEEERLCQIHKHEIPAILNGLKHQAKIGKYFIIGMFFGMLVTVGLIASTERIKTEQSKFEIKENVSLKPPRELPKDEIEFDEIKIPTNLREVIL